jgi:ketosteroid isomerase-like protein
MRRGRVELSVSLDLDEPSPRAFEQLVTVRRRRCCLKPSHQLAQLNRPFFISHRLTILVVTPGAGASSGSPSRSPTGAFHGTCGAMPPPPRPPFSISLRQTAWLSRRGGGILGRAMSQQNVELVRGAYEAIARRDREALDAILADHVAPDFEFEAVLTGATYKGTDALRELLDDIQDIVGYMPEVQEAVDLDEHVLVVLRMSGRGSQSGVSVEQQGAVLFSFAGSRLVSGKSFASRAEALEAVGLRE